MGDTALNNRIRHYRQMRGWTQADLAHRVGTTAATVSRLETEEMSVSTDWLQKFAAAFRVQIADLLDEPARARIPLLGTIGRDGVLAPERAAYAERVTLDVPAERPVAVRLAADVGPYRAGDVLIANRFDGADISNAVGYDCLAGLPDGGVVLRRVVKGRGGRYTLVPDEPGGAVRHDEPLEWAARLVMWVRYI